MTDLTKLSLADASKGLKAKSFTATELTGAYLSAIEAANPVLNAYVAARQILDGFKPEYDSTVTSNLWRVGSVMLG